MTLGLTHTAKRMSDYMSDPVEDAYNKSKEERSEYVEVDADGMVDRELVSSLKEIKGEINLVYSKLISNPYLAPDLIDDARSSLVRTVGLLMEYNIPLQHEGKTRTADDIIRESLAELGGLLGAKGAIAALRAKRSFQQTWADYRNSEDFEVYHDPETDDYYFIDPDTGDEIDCDVNGIPLE
jgi:hypothetical protein